MIQQNVADVLSRVPGDDRHTLWGLGPLELHDAYWRAHGVQCIRRGEAVPVQAGVDLFMLIEPGQLILFDIVAEAPRLAWRAAAVTRLRVTPAEEQPYTERVEVDEDGLVTKVSRHYRGAAQAANAVILTRKRRIVRAWMTPGGRRDKWKRIRRAVGWENIDHSRCSGGRFILGQPREEDALISQLVAVWPDPASAIEGIAQVRDGVWAMAGFVLDAETPTVGPAWLGQTDAGNALPCVIGPTWIADRPASGSVPAVRVRDIKEIDPSKLKDDVTPARSSRTGYALAKRLVDAFLSLVGLVLASPFLLVCAISIWIEDGRPVFYGHVRQSRHGRPFRCWKIRTMCLDADRMKQALAGANECDGPQFSVTNDPRVTRVGRALRRYHLDELPQLWNVLVGDMSLVGPRPSPESENRICPEWREARLSVLPGVTGLWQVMRTREPGLDFQEWIRYDIEYVERASFWFDLTILFKTLWVLVPRRSDPCD